MHQQPCASEFQQALRETHMVRMNVGEQDLADFGPWRADAFESTLERLKTRLRVHTAINEHEPVRPPQQIHIDPA